MNERELTRLSAYLDGSLPPEEAQALERELGARPELAAELAALRTQDRALAAAFAPLREGVARRARTLAPPVVPHRPTRAAGPGRAAFPARRLPPWVWLLAGAAAGVLVTGSLLDWGAAPERAAPLLPVEPPLARLEQALGPVERVEAGVAAVPLATGAALAPGTCLRTPARAKCTLLFADGSRLRLDGETELVLAGPRHVALRRGRVYADIQPSSERFRAEAGPSLVEVLGTRLDLAQTIGALDGEHAGRALTELVLLEGSALLCGTRVETGQLATAIDGSFAHAREAQDLLLVTSWVNELIAFEPEREREFQERVDALLAMLGRTKMAHLYESEIRSLGAHCALPLLRYVESEDSRKEAPRRRNAARILADVVTHEHLAGLAVLLTDRDREVRVSAARGVVRLTGGPGEPPTDFAGEDFVERAARWRAWIERS